MSYMFTSDPLCLLNIDANVCKCLLLSEVDVIGLLETDAARPYIGNHDIASWLSERLKMHVDYGPGSNDHTWGCLVLSKYPILKTEHHLLPSPDG